MVNVIILINMINIPPINLQLIALLLLILTLCSSADIYNEILSLPVSPGALRIEFSPNLSYLALVYGYYVEMHSGINTALLQRTYPLGYNVTGFAFSHDQSMYAVGLKNFTGEDTYYTVFKSIIRAQEGVIQNTEDPEIKGALTEANLIKYLCFSADDSAIVAGTSSNRIYYIRFKQVLQTQILFDSNLPISQVACSHTDPLEFAVSGSAEGQPSKIKIYSLSPLDYKISLKRNVDLGDASEGVYDLVYGYDGKYLYRATSGALYRTDLGTFEESKIETSAGLKDFRKVRVTAKDEVMAASTANNQLVILRTTSSQSQPHFSATQQQILPTPTSQFALSRHPNTILALTNTTTASLTAQCPISQYLSPADSTCQPCFSNCTMCLDASETCRSCGEAFYVTKYYECLRCMDRCKLCDSGTVCKQCYSPFILITGGFCGCGSGFYPGDKACLPCGYQCKECANNKTCLACEKPFILNPISHSCVCQKGTFQSKNACNSCPQNCLDCSSPQLCFQCSQGYKLESGACEKEFPMWIIIVIVVGVVVLVAVAALVGWRFYRKSKKNRQEKSLLSAEKGDEDY